MKSTIIDDKTLVHSRKLHSSKINCIHVQVNNFLDIIDEFETYISSTTWIDNLDEIAQLTFKANVKKTIAKVVNDIIAKVKTSSKLNEDIGEYLVSYSAQKSLEINYKHTLIPLAELIKEKVSGNPGFDYHSISQNNIIVFGEAKFSLYDTPRTRALSQIVEFIDDRDNAELLWLKPFLNEDAIKNILNDKKGYAAAFSYNNKDLQLTFKNAINATELDTLVNHEEIYLIAVELC